MAAQKEDVDETSSEKDVISKPENFTTTLGFMFLFNALRCGIVNHALDRVHKIHLAMKKQQGLFGKMYKYCLETMCSIGHKFQYWGILRQKSITDATHHEDIISDIPQFLPMSEITLNPSLNELGILEEEEISKHYSISSNCHEAQKQNKSQNECETYITEKHSETEPTDDFKITNPDFYKNLILPTEDLDLPFSDVNPYMSQLCSPYQIKNLEEKSFESQKNQKNFRSSLDCLLDWTDEETENSGNVYFEKIQQNFDALTETKNKLISLDKIVTNSLNQVSNENISSNKDEMNKKLVSNAWTPSNTDQSSVQSKMFFENQEKRSSIELLSSKEEILYESVEEERELGLKNDVIDDQTESEKMVTDLFQDIEERTEKMSFCDENLPHSIPKMIQISNGGTLEILGIKTGTEITQNCSKIEKDSDHEIMKSQTNEDLIDAINQSIDDSKVTEQTTSSDDCISNLQMSEEFPIMQAPLLEATEEMSKNIDVHTQSTPNTVVNGNDDRSGSSISEENMHVDIFSRDEISEEQIETHSDARYKEEQDKKHVIVDKPQSKQTSQEVSNHVECNENIENEDHYHQLNGSSPLNDEHIESLESIDFSEKYQHIEDNETSQNNNEVSNNQANSSTRLAEKDHNSSAEETLHQEFQTNSGRALDVEQTDLVSGIFYARIYSETDYNILEEVPPQQICSTFESTDESNNLESQISIEQPSGTLEIPYLSSIENPLNLNEAGAKTLQINYSQSIDKSNCSSQTDLRRMSPSTETSKEENSLVTPHQQHDIIQFLEFEVQCIPVHSSERFSTGIYGLDKNDEDFTIVIDVTGDNNEEFFVSNVPVEDVVHPEVINDHSWSHSHELFTSGLETLFEEEVLGNYGSQTEDKVNPDQIVERNVWQKVVHIPIPDMSPTQSPVPKCSCDDEDDEEQCTNNDSRVFGCKNIVAEEIYSDQDDSNFHDETFSRSETAYSNEFNSPHRSSSRSLKGFFRKKWTQLKKSRSKLDLSQTLSNEDLTVKSKWKKSVPDMTFPESWSHPTSPGSSLNGTLSHSARKSWAGSTRSFFSGKRKRGKLSIDSTTTTATATTAPDDDDDPHFRSNNVLTKWQQSLSIPNIPAAMYHDNVDATPNFTSMSCEDLSHLQQHQVASDNLTSKRQKKPLTLRKKFFGFKSRRKSNQETSFET